MGHGRTYVARLFLRDVDFNVEPDDTESPSLEMVEVQISDFWLLELTFLPRK